MHMFSLLIEVIELCDINVNLEFECNIIRSVPHKLSTWEVKMVIKHATSVEDQGENYDLNRKMQLTFYMPVTSWDVGGLCFLYSKI